MVRGRELGTLASLRLPRQVFVRDRKCRLPHEESYGYNRNERLPSAFPKMGKGPRNEADEGAPITRIKRREALLYLQNSHPHQSLTRQLPHLGEAFKMRWLSFELLSFTRTKFRKLPKDQRTNSQLHCVEQNIRVASNLLVRVISSPAPR